MDKNSIVLKALGVRYKKLSNYDVVKEIESLFATHGWPLGQAYKDILHEDWGGPYGHLPFEAYKWAGNQKPQRSILWRLSVIPLGIWLAMLFAFIPFLWLFTGRAYYKADPHKKTISSFTVAWIDKCFDRN